MRDAVMASLPDGARRVAKALQDNGHHRRPVMLADTIRTLQLVADAQSDDQHRRTAQVA